MTFVGTHHDGHLIVHEDNTVVEAFADDHVVDGDLSVLSNLHSDGILLQQQLLFQ